MLRDFTVAVRLMRRVLQACWLIGVIFASPAVAQDAAQEAAPEVAMKSPNISSVTVDWDAARAALAALQQAGSGDAPAGAPAPDVFAQLNIATATIFAKIATSPVPVLLPFDTAAFLHDQAQATGGDATKYLAGFMPTFFFPGPSG
jgi:hypothetical protein